MKQEWIFLTVACISLTIPTSCVQPLVCSPCQITLRTSVKPGEIAEWNAQVFEGTSPIYAHQLVLQCHTTNAVRVVYITDEGKRLLVETLSNGLIPDKRLVCHDGKYWRRHNNGSLDGVVKTAMCCSHELLFFSYVNGDTCTWNNCPTTSPNKWNIHIIPHTHDDLGWTSKVDDYYVREVRYIFNTFLIELAKNPNRKFTYCETGYLTRYMEDSSDRVDQLKKFIQTGQLEILGGGWVQPDEAASHYYELLNVYTLGLGILNRTFGECAHPKTAWQIDPFGHSREHANLVAQMGYESIWFARNHYLDFNLRANNKSLQMTWHTSDDNANQIFTGVYQSGGYWVPGGGSSSFCFDINCIAEPIQDNPNLENYNADKRVAEFVSYLNGVNATQQTNHFFILIGSDFRYQDANTYFVNLDKLIKYLNQNYSDTLTAFYSTPACYTQTVKNLTGIQWPNKNDDFFPYASGAHSYWTGYFTSKPGLKGIVRKSSALLQLVWQLQSLALSSWTDQIGQQIEILERAVALSQHHDGITGTSKEFVTQDYIYRLTKGWTAAEIVINSALQAISQKQKNNQTQLPLQIICRTINESECLFTKTNVNEFVITVHNGNGQPMNTLVRVPLYQNPSGLSITDGNGDSIPTQLNPVFVNPGQIDNPNIAPYEAIFLATLPAIGFRTYFISTSGTLDRKKFYQEKSLRPKVKAGVNSISNGLVQLDFDTNGLLSTYHDLTSGANHPLKQEFLYYIGSGSEDQPSGAYVFRPQPGNATPVGFTGPFTVTIINGSNVVEARQIISSWISQTIRLTSGKKLVEFEWTIGPIPKDNNIGKEVITRYTTGIASNGTFWTDANGRQLLKRTRNWSESYTYLNTEPASGNYYPIDSRIIISDGTTSMAVLTDRSNGGSSLTDGQVEVMLHRRLFVDDNFGVNEALNEPGRDGRGLVVRGKHWLVFGPSSDVTKGHRSLAYEILHAPFLTFSTYASNNQYKTDFVTDVHDSYSQVYKILSRKGWEEYSGLAQALPPNINLLTLKQLDANNILIRLEHIYQKNEDPILSQPVSIDLSTIFSDLKISSVQLLSLAGNTVIKENVNTQITLNPMDITTVKVQASLSTGCTCQTTWLTSDINPCNCYKFVGTTSNSWTNANNDCKTQNSRATLASIDSAFDNNDILTMAKTQTSSCSNLFIGLHQISSSSNWTWINNDPSAYRNWQSGYPMSNNNSCTQFDTNSGKWANIDCNTITGCYICEIRNS